MNDRFFLGYPVDFNGICWVYPTKIKDLVGNNDYDLYLRLLTLSQEDIDDNLIKDSPDNFQSLTPFEYLLNIAYYDAEIEQKIKEAFKFFTHEDIIMLYEQKTIIIGDVSSFTSLDKLKQITENNYFDFQNLIRQSGGRKPVDRPNPNESEKVRKMKAKARYRDKIKAKQGDGLNLSSMLAAICCMNMNLNPLNIGELSYPAIQSLFSMYQDKEKYDLDIKSILAGADAKKIKPKYWIRNLED